MNDEGPRPKAPRLEDTVEEMRRQQETLMKMIVETNKNIHESVKLAHLAIESTKGLAEKMSHVQTPTSAAPAQPGMPVQQVEAISTAWRSAAAPVVEGAASHAATNAVKLMKQSSPKLPEAILKGMEKAAQGFLKDMRKYARSKKAFDDAIAKLNVMTEDHEHTRYPPGIRPFASSSTFVELDDVFSKTRAEAVSLSLTIPAGTSRRDAMRLTHHFLTSHMKTIELEALADHRDQMNRMASKDMFISRCKSAAGEIVTKDADLRNLSIDSPNRMIV